MSETQQSNLNAATQFFNKKAASLAVVKTTTTQNGNTIDWIPIESQGEIANAPSSPPTAMAAGSSTTPLSELEVDGAEKGPPGTVPILRQDLALLNPDQSLKERLSKSAPPAESSGADKNVSQSHWYALSDQTVDNNGASGLFSLYHAYVQSSGDFSLIQTAVSRENVPLPGSTNGVRQTCEAGWINEPAQVAQPHLFTFFTTDGYANVGDKIGGWNTDVKGWIQVDNTFYPGMIFPNTSVVGGSQYELQIQYTLYQGNWWLYVQDRYIGYYPGSLYSTNISDASATLADHASSNAFYGEIYQQESNFTTTDMGSGEFASTGWGKSAYIRKLSYTDRNGSSHDYGGQSTTVSDPSRYTLEEHFNSGTDDGSYQFLGGPGAGGVIGG